MSANRDAAAVLVVADDEGARASLAAGLERGGYTPVVVESAESGLTRLRHARVRPAVVIVRLDRGAEIEFLEAARRLDPVLGAVAIASGLTGGHEGADGLQGVTLLVEPIDAPDLLHAVAFQLRRRLEGAAGVESRRLLGDAIEARIVGVERKFEQFAAASLEVLVTAFEARDAFFSGHSQRVAQLSASLADALGRSDEEVESVRLAGRLHDIGMLWVSDRVVHKEGPLSPGERDQIQQHPVVGHHILLPYAHLAEVSRFVRAHHERWDGAGYPDGLAGLAIPWGARVIAVAEAYDAMVTARAHRVEVMTRLAAVRELQRLGGTAFEPEVVEVLASMVGRRRTLEFVSDRPREQPKPAEGRITAA